MKEKFKTTVKFALVIAVGFYMGYLTYGLHKIVEQFEKFQDKQEAYNKDVDLTFRAIRDKADRAEVLGNMGYQYSLQNSAKLQKLKVGQTVKVIIKEGDQE